MKIRVARAIRACEIENKPWERDQVAPYPQFDELWQEGEKERYLAMAEGALRCVKHPDSRMVKAGEAWRAHCSDDDSFYQEMIQAALYPEDYAP